MWHARVRSRALITTGSKTIKALTLSEDVSMKSHQDRASAGAILVPGRMFQMMSKSCKKKGTIKLGNRTVCKGL